MITVPQPAPPLHWQTHHDLATLIEARSVAGGRCFTLRPVLPQDDLLRAERVIGLSPAAGGQRFFGAVSERVGGPPDRLTA